MDHHGRPDCIIIDGSRTNHQAVIYSDAEDRRRDRSRCLLNPTRIRRSKYLDNRIEQGHWRIRRRIRSMPGFKSTANADLILPDIEMVHMMRKRQTRLADNPRPSNAEQFELITA